MLGFLFGTLCLVGLVAAVRGGCGHRHHGRCGRGWHGRRGCGGWHDGGWHRGRGGWRGGEGPGWGERGGPFRGAGHLPLRFVFERLRTTPGQERVFYEAASELESRLEALRGEAARSRHDLAEALRAGALDTERLNAARERQARELREAQDAVQAALAKVHAALEPAQREQLAALIAQGPSAGPRPDDEPTSWV